MSYGYDEVGHWVCRTGHQVSNWLSECYECGTALEAETGLEAPDPAAVSDREWQGYWDMRMEVEGSWGDA